MKNRIALWKKVFDTDHNSISQGLFRLGWDLAAFSCIVEMVRQAPDGDGNNKRLNGMVLEMLGTGFWSNTMQGVRRLVERETIHGPRGVCSLRGLIDDAKAIRHRLTRRVFVEEIAGLEYDHAAIEARYWQWMMAQPAGEAHWVPQEFHFERSRERHITFDGLSGTTPDTRSPDDVIREEVFAALEQRLSALDGVVDHVNVKIAHAATEFSRTGRVLPQWNLDDARNAIKELAQIAQHVGDWLCASGIGTVLPHPSFDLFAHLDQPLFVGDPQPLRDLWAKLDAEMSEWCRVDTKAPWP